MFDPFGDFETRGYLQNFEGLKRMDEVKVLEHTFFEANLEDAFKFLGTVKEALTYKHFLKVHHVLFSDFYPWAGQDRLQLGVGKFVEKGSFQFEESSLAQRAVEWGLEMGNDPLVLAKKPGVVMGQFAWGHPLLDGYFQSLIRKLPARKVWMDHIKALPGLDGAHSADDNMAYAADDAQAKQRYEEASQLRNRSQQG